MKILSKKEFEYDVATITGYTDESSTELITKSLLGATTAGLVSLRLGLKGTQQVQILDSDPVFQVGGCGWNATGSTTFAQTPLTVCPEKINENLCPDDLYSTYQSMLLSPGQAEENVPFIDQITALKVKQIQQRIEKQLWQATTGRGDCFNGFSALIVSGATGVETSNGAIWSGVTTYTTGNPVYEVDQMIAKLDDDAMSREDLIVFVSPKNFRLYVQTLRQMNLFVDFVGNTLISNTQIIHPNSNIKVVSTIGLSGNDQVVLVLINLVLFLIL